MDHALMELPRPPSTKRKSGKKELTGLNVDIAENGYVLRLNYEEEEGKEYPKHSSEQKVFESARTLIEYLEDALEG